MDEVERFVNDNHLHIDCQDLQALCFQKYCSCGHTNILPFSSFISANTANLNASVSIYSLTSSLRPYLFWTHFLGQSLGQCWLTSYPHCCRMPNSMSSPLQSQPVLAADSPLVATSNDSYLSWALFLYKSLTEAKQIISVRSICFCWPFVQWGTTAHIHRTEKELKRRTLFLFLTELPQAVTQPQHKLRTSPEGKNYVEQAKSWINSCHIL